MQRTVFERCPPNESVVRHALHGTEPGVVWFDGLTPSEHPELTGQIAADLVIVGGGYTGLWTAVRAKERDPEARVVLLEGKRIGWAASGRNGGFCKVSLTHGRDNGLRRWPDELDAIDTLAERNLADLADTIDRYGIEADVERTGVIKVAVEPHEVEWLRARDRDDRQVYLDSQAMRAAVNSPTYLAGHWDKNDLMVHPAKLALELARVAVELGVQVFEESSVIGLEEQGSHMMVRTAAGSVRAGRVALGTNVFPSLLKRNRFMTVPVYDYVLATEPLTATQLREIGWQGRQGISDLANQFHYYRLTGDNRIVFGGYDAIYHFGRRIRPEYNERPESFHTLARHFFTTFPALEGVRFTHRWAGVIDTCSQFCAFFGTAHRGKVAYATGFTGLGVASTRFAGDVMLDLLEGADTERTSLRMVRKRPLPFPPEPFTSIGINATRWSLARADRNQGRRNLLLRTLDAAGLGFES
ncbi:FAD-dependent oxidoreductase [Nocardia sp. SYP-A9097]|uniref:NAD(P)/FAD-dependent oxidoreductase n=1 Tax=Nocardia sp. SYP-A9097 TaxID=2663237 RepID=UPI00129B97B3|nr:FAD-binding oxidoreductase [Nocardia sp. SYP-A9097]MRH92176.1 FAD-dependent oxidoreductase [Nocardia sp. SYP-A9097]